MNTYVGGTTVEIILRFTDADGAAVDPATVTAYIKTPAGTVTTYTYGVDSALTKVTTGVYKLAYTLATTAAAGTYWYGARGAGTYNATNDGCFTARDWVFD